MYYGRSRLATSVLTTSLVLALGIPCPMPAGAASAAPSPNVRVSQDAFPAHAEPSIAVNPQNPQNLLGASMLIGRGETMLGAYASFDGGRTWHDYGPLPMPPNTSFGDDVTAAFDGHGIGFIDAMATSGAARNDRGVYVWRTDDGGRTFHQPVAAMRHQFADHPWMTAAGPGINAGNVYAAWVAEDHAALGFSRSTDDGHRFSAPRDIATPSGGVSIPAAAAGPGGAVYVTYESSRQGADTPTEPDANPVDGRLPVQPAAQRQAAGNTAPGIPAGVNDAQVEIVSSADGGRRFGHPVVVGPAPSFIAVSPQLDLPTGQSVAVDPHGGSVYVTYLSYRAGSRHADVLLSRSRTAGRSWEAPVPVSTGAAFYFQPQVVVDDAGGVAITYFALQHGRVSVLLARSTTDGAAFTAPVPVTSAPFDPMHGIRGGGKGGKDSLWWIGDYQGLAAGGGMLHPFWNDTRPGHLEIFTAAIPA